MSSPLTEPKPQQAAAIDARHDEAIIVAGAGSGKTGVLAACVARSVVDDELEAESVLAITFTRKAAAEMRDRIRGMRLDLLQIRDGLDSRPAVPDSEPEIATIDAFCQGIVRRNSLELGIDPRFDVVDDTDPELTAVAWANTLAAFSSANGTVGFELLAKYDDNPRASLEANIRSVHARLRTGGQQNPRVAVPAESALVADAEGHIKKVRTLAAELLEESKEWADGASNAETRNRAEALLHVSLETIGSVPDKVTYRTSGDIKGSETAADLNDLLTLAKGSSATVNARADLVLMASLVELYDEAWVKVKSDAGSLDFSDLALLTRGLLQARKDDALSAGRTDDWRPAGARFARVFLDEAQDINRVQADLIALIAPEGKYYSVGDVAQSIYRFRHAEVSIFEERAATLGKKGLRFELSTNFRSVGEILNFNNHAFAAKGLSGLVKLEPFDSGPAVESPVEILIEDKDRIEERLQHEDEPPEWLEEVVDSGWRYAEAAAVAQRIEELIKTGECDASDVTILGRAVSSLKPFAEALRSRNIKATIEGAGGLWLRPEVSDLVALLAATGNACHEERFFQLLYSPICGLSVDALVLVAAQARSKEVPLLTALRSVDLDAQDAEVRDRFVIWFDRQRALAGRRSISDAIEAALVETGYDLYLLGLPAGDRRFANVRRMQSLASAWESEHGADPAGFAREADTRLASSDNKRDGEAVVEPDLGDDAEGGSTGAVRLMTVHQAKGLEFKVTVVVDLGRGANNDSAVLSVSADGANILFRWRETIGGSSAVTFAQADFIAAEKEADIAEEVRVAYVAFTRPEDRLILSGSFGGSLKPKPELTGAGGSNTNLGRFMEAGLLPGLDKYLADPEGHRTWSEEYPGGAGIKVSVDWGQALDDHARSRPPAAEPGVQPDMHPMPGAMDPKPVPLRPTSFSYSGLQVASRCAFRWYSETVVKLSPVAEARATEPGRSGSGSLRPNQRGSILHGLLEHAGFADDFPDIAAVKAEAALLDITVNDADAEHISSLARNVLESSTWARLTAIEESSGRVCREEGFAVILDCGSDSVPLRGIFDVFAQEAGGKIVVVDWKSSDGAAAAPDLEAKVFEDYEIQRQAYALAALSSRRNGESPAEVEVIHLYAERPDEPVFQIFTQADAERLASDLAGRATPLLNGEVPVTEKPWVGVCQGCPARERICSKSREEVEALQAPA